MFQTDTRGALTGSILLFFASIVLGMLLLVAFKPGADLMLNQSAQYAESEQAAKGIGMLAMLWSNLHFIVVAFGGLGVLASAVFYSRVR